MELSFVNTPRVGGAALYPCRTPEHGDPAYASNAVPGLVCTAVQGRRMYTAVIIGVRLQCDPLHDDVCIITEVDSVCGRTPAGTE